MIARFISIIFLVLLIGITGRSQCVGGITSFPFVQDFEANNGGWTTGGAGSDWAWGTPAKPVINSAGSGSKCWVIGGLTGSSYTNSEASWLQSPCFDFTNLDNPYIQFKVFWEMEQRFDGGSLQYSIDNGATWSTLGASNDPVNCLNENWFNNGGITYLSPLSSDRNGWSGNIQSGSGSCNGGSGSGKWVTAKHTMPALGGTSGVQFRFIFGAGTICNSYDGFAIDSFSIGEAPPNDASFTYTCGQNRSVNFTSTSALCPTQYDWDFGEPSSGTSNNAVVRNPTHQYASAGTYTVTLTVKGPGNLPSIITKPITVLEANVTMLTAADCQENKGGSLRATVTGTSSPVNYSWNTVPVQTGATASNLGAGVYTVTISALNSCDAVVTGTVETDLSCIGIFFPTAFTPNNDGKNDGFGPLGSLAILRDYKFSVYNRWGQKVFSSVNPFQKWYGRVGGFDTDSNIFVWYAEFILPGKAKELRKGTVVLIR